MDGAPELVLFMERMYRNWEALDAGVFADAIARQPGSLMIGSDPGEWWAGYEAISAVVRVQFREFQEELPKIHFEIEQIDAWKEGTVGWIASRALMAIEGMAPLPTRSTVVVREEGAFWRIVQWHFSMPVSNEDALGIGLTTAVEEILAMVQDERPPVTAVGADGTVTIVFTDIEGSTALMESLGEQRWLELLDWHDRAVRQQTTLFGGSVVKGQGDGFMLAFPATGSAVASAVAIQRALSAGCDGVLVPVRMGMHRGNAKAEAGDFFGRTVVIAARVASSAAGGEILVSQEVQEGLGGAFPLASARSLALKGLSGQHAVFPVLWK
jgi:class 3 adenylate cyclase